MPGDRFPLPPAVGGTSAGPMPCPARNAPDAAAGVYPLAAPGKGVPRLTVLLLALVPAAAAPPALRLAPIRNVSASSGPPAASSGPPAVLARGDLRRALARGAVSLSRSRLTAPPPALVTGGVHVTDWPAGLAGSPASDAARKRSSPRELSSPCGVAWPVSCETSAWTSDAGVRGTDLRPAPEWRSMSLEVPLRRGVFCCGFSTRVPMGHDPDAARLPPRGLKVAGDCEGQRPPVAERWPRERDRRRADAASRVSALAQILMATRRHSERSRQSLTRPYCPAPRERSTAYFWLMIVVPCVCARGSLFQSDGRVIK